jgi:hypothetical protein
MSAARTHRLLFALVLAPLGAGCGLFTSPEDGERFDAQAALADYEALSGMLSSADLAALAALGGRTPVAPGAAPPASNGREHTAPALARPGSGAGLAPLISGTHRGMTFVYDAAAGRWVQDPTRRGAPETGVRFVLYELDDQGVPISGREIGWADLIDEGDSSPEDIVLRLRVVTHGSIRLDYRTTVDVGLTWGKLGVLGFLRGEGTARLDFDIGVDARRSLGRTELDVEFDLALAARGFQATGSVRGLEESTGRAGEVHVSVRHRRHTLEVDATGAGGRIEGRVLLDGKLFATLSGDADSPTIVSADGDPLTPAEQLVLLRVVGTVDDIFQFVKNLVQPAGGLVLLGVMLS